MTRSPSDIRAGGAFVELYAEDRMLQRGLAGAQRKLRAFAQGVQTISRSMFAGGLMGTFGLGISAKTFAEFDSQMRAVRGITGATAADFAMLREEAAKLGRETSFTANEVASAMTELARGGQKASEIIDSMNSILSLAKGTMTDLTLATQTVVKIMNQFGVSTREAARVVDVLTLAANNSVTTVEELAEAFVYAGPDMRRAGASVEETAALFAILANAGVNASAAGTQLRRVVRNLADPTVRKRLKDAFDVDVSDAEGNFAGVEQTLFQLEAAIGRLSRVDVTAMFETMFGRGSNAAAVIGANKDMFEKLIKTLAEGRGEAGRLSDEMEQGLKGTFIKLSSAFEGFQIAIGDAMSSSLIDLFKSMREGLAMLTAWIENNKTLVATLGNLTFAITAAGAAGLAFGVFLRGLDVLISGVAKSMYPLGKTLELFRSFGPTFTMIARSMGEFGETLFYTLRGIIVNNYKLGASWRYLVKYGIQQNQYAGPLRTAYSRMGVSLGYLKDMAEGAANGIKAMLTVTKKSSRQFKDRPFTQQLAIGLKLLRRQAQATGRQFGQMAAQFASIARSRFSAFVQPIVQSLSNLQARLATAARGFSLLGASMVLGYGAQRIQQFFRNLPANALNAAKAVDMFGGRLINMFRNWQQGQKRASLGGFLRGMVGLHKMLLSQIIATDKGMARWFVTIQRGAIAAAGALRALTAAVAGTVAGMVGMIILSEVAVWIYDALKAIGKFVVGVRNAKEAADELVLGFQDRQTSSNVSDQQLTDARTAMMKLGNVSNMTAEQSERLWNSVAILEREYGYLGVAVDDTTGRITNLLQVMARLDAASSQPKSLGAMQEEMDAVQAKMDEIRNDRNSWGTYQDDDGKFYSKDALEALETLKERQAELTREVRQYEDALRAVGMTDKEIQDLKAQGHEGERIALAEIEAALALEEERLKRIADLEKQRADDRAKFSEDIETRLWQNRIKLSKEGHAQELALMDQQFAQEMRQLKEIKATKEQVAKLLEAQEMERQLLVEQFEREHADNMAQYAEETAQLRADLELDGHALRMRQIGLEQQEAERALRERLAGSPTDMIDKELAALREIYDLKRDIADQEERQRTIEERAQQGLKYLETVADYAKQVIEQKKAEAALFDALSARSIGGGFGSSRLAQQIDLNAPIEKDQLDALEDLIEETQETNRLLRDIQPQGAFGLPGIL